MADSAIRAAGGADAPLSYLVPGAAVIRIKQIHVKYADSGAALDWLPAVRIVDDAGHTMGTAADQGVIVTAGDSADVSFFPGVKPTVASGFTNDLAPFAYLSAFATTSIPGGAVLTQISLQDGLNATLIGHPGQVFGSRSTVLGGVVTYGLGILQAGIYQISVVMFITGGTAGARIDTTDLAYGLPGSSTSPSQSLYSSGRQAVLFGDQWDPGIAPAKTFWTEYWDFDPTSVPSVMIANATNHGVAAGNVETHLWVQQVTTYNVPAGSWA